MRGAVMSKTRRSFLLLGFPAAVCAALASAQENPPPRPVRRRQQPQGLPPLAGSEEEPLKANLRPILKERQEEIKKQTLKLFELASDLKKEVEKTDSADVLSLPLLRKAEEVEKIAKRIQTLARG
jgi:hypothetical protein